MNELAKDFSDLERFVDAGWALPREQDRWARRVSSTSSEIKDFYETMLPRMDSIVSYLERYSLETLPEKERPLFFLALAFMDVAPAWEVFQAPDLPEPVFPIARMHVVEREYPWEKIAVGG